MNGRESPVVSQQELAELETFKAQLREVKRQYLAKRSEIMEKLSAGAEVEPGPYRAFVRINARLAVE